MEAGTHADLVAELVEQALELDPAERINFLDRACDEDTELRGEVESLLRFQPQARGFIESPAYEMVAETLLEETGQLQAGDELASYRIRSPLGEGGMGEVYLADDLQFGRQVALKLVKRAFNRGEFIRQFAREERILAGLNHPHIARLYGGGVTPDELPYFVMEYVPGERLTEHCERLQLDLYARLELFLKVCAGVSYAHQRLVIHRDLKPANIRVTPEGEPKLLDFGIARLLDDNNSAPEQTITLQSVMTPEYASPEQVRGDAMTTASDVYSLGVLLYELLTGEKPYRFANRRPDEISRVITEQIPTRPSENRKSLRGDLDNIVLMAMRKEPERRYASVGQFGEDIRRHLRGLPVIARQDTWSYRASKFIRRHKVAAAGAALVLVTLCGGILTTSWQARRAQQERARAQQRFEEVRRLARALIFEIHDSVANLPGSTPTRQLIVTRALEYLNQLAREAGDDPGLLRELTSAYVKVGNVQGNPNNSNLGDTAGALESYQNAKRIIDQLLDAEPGDPQTRRQLGVVQEKMSEVQAARGDLTAAIANAHRSLAAFKTIADQSGGDVSAQQSLAISHFKLGDVLGNPNFPNAGDGNEALRNYHAALHLLQSITSAGGDLRTQRLLGVVQERLGTIFEALHDLPEAEHHYRESAAIRLRLAEQHPDNTDAVRDAAIAHEKMANVQTAAGDLAAALENRQRSLEIFRRLAEADPKNVLAQRSLGISYLHLAELLGSPESPSLGRVAEAIAHYQHAQDVLSRTSDPNDPKVRVRLELIENRLRALR